jgi:hypothetical protein
VLIHVVGKDKDKNGRGKQERKMRKQKECSQKMFSSSRFIK